MKQKNKKKLSYFRLKLGSYMSEHHPERLQDMEFVAARADMALTVYCDAVVQDFTHIEAEDMVSEASYQGLHFSEYNMLIFVLENEFERELLAPLPEKLVPILLSNKTVQATFDRFGLTDTLASDKRYGRLHAELTDTIVLLVENSNLPAIRLTEEASPKALQAEAAHAKFLMPFLIVQRYNGSLSALTGSSPADGEKNLYRRISLFQGGIAIFRIHTVVFISPNLAGPGYRGEYRHDKNTAYSDSLDARRNN